MTKNESDSRFHNNVKTEITNHNKNNVSSGFLVNEDESMSQIDIILKTLHFSPVSVMSMGINPLLA